VDAAGGQLQLDRLSVTLPQGAIGSSGGVLSLVPLDAAGVPQPGNGFQLGSGAFIIAVNDAASGAPITQLATPMTIEYRLSPDEVNKASGDLSRLRIATLIDNTWVALACTTADSVVSCSVPHLSLFALLISPPQAGSLDAPLADGWFFKQTNGFSGAGDAGYAVEDDAQASFWSEFQRLGGVQRVGYPVTGRFQYGGYLTQAFQRMVLQWRPELGQAVPLNVFDELGIHGADAWLEHARQVPASVDSSGADDPLDWEAVVARHVELLDPYPALHDFYTSDPDALTTYGLPVSVKDYGPMVTVRLQRGSLQLWTVDTPWAAAGTVVGGNAGDLAKEAGLWPLTALAPTASVPLSAQAP
jgi:hypothetical protein